MLKNRAIAFRKTVSNPRHYPAAVLAMAAVAVGVAPLTASAAAGTAAKPAAATSTVKPAVTTDSTQGRAAVPASPYAGATMAQLEPTGTVGSQSHISLSSDQMANAKSIVKAAEDMHLTPYAATIAVATSMQESKLQNLNVAVDHDSLGLFQQRPSCGWGSPAQLEDPTYAATAFLKNLPSDYQNMPLHTAAQTVQQSFNGSLYSQWEDQAAHIVYTVVGH